MKYAIVKILDEKSPTWPEIAKDYLEHARVNKKPKTFSTERSIIRLFSKFIGAPEIIKVSQQDINRWILTMRQATQNTLHQRLMTIRLVFKYAQGSGKLHVNPFFGIKLPPLLRTGRSLADDELKRFMAIVKPKFIGAIRLGLYTGMRIGEVCSLQWSQVYADHIFIPAEKTKTGKERVVLLNSQAAIVLRARSKGRVFQFAAATLRSEIVRCWKKLGMGRIRFHDLRHTAATRYMDQKPTPDIFGMMDAFGWSSIQSAAYYQHGSLNRQAPMLGIKYDI